MIFSAALRGESVVATDMSRLTRARLVNNAGIVPTPLPIHEATAEQWDTTMNVNARSVFLGCKYATRQMLKQELTPGADRGWIVNIASIAALIGRSSLRMSPVPEEL